MIGLGGCSSTANMSCTTLLPDYNKPQQDMHTSVSMMKDEFNSSDAGKLSPSDKNHSDVSGAPAEVATEEDSNICVDSRSSSPNTYVNGSGAASAGNTAANEGDANDDDTEENAPSSPGVPLRQPGANGMDTAAAATATAPGSLAMNDYATMFARHRLAMLRGEPIPPETSKLLRGMLQDKEKMMEAHKAVARQVMGGTDDHSIMSKLLQPGAMEKQGGVGGGDRAKMSAGFDGDTESLHSRSLSPGDISDDSDVGGEDNDGKTSADKVRDDCSTTESTEDSLEAKRARVENIITNMRTSPTRNLSDNNNIGESRRQKRKQYTPQQHGDPRVECSSSKQIRLEPDHIKNQLHRMQQLSMMHNRNGHMDMFGKELPFSPFFGDAAKRLNPPEGVAPSPLERLDLFRRFPMAPYESNPFDPSNFLKQTNNNKPVRDHELNKQANSSETNNNNVNNDLTDLAKILKAEIANSVGNLVDTIVARYVTSHKQDEKSPSAKDSISESQKDRAQSKPREEQKPPTPDPSKPPRTKVTENKVLNPLIENNLKTFEELSRPHHPMFPPPYFPPMNIPSMQPLYPNKEPEQTEALPLIVSTPKKKRTKVTDTRLSPRAARALLQENTHPGMEENKHSPIPHLPHPHPHLPPHPLLEHYQHPLIPVSLPTSVAIPNPILQHSDVLAMHSHATEHNMFSDMLHQHRHAAAAAAAAAHLPSRSPPMGDYSSPNSAHIPTSEGMYMKTDDSFDGQSMSDAQSNYNGLQTSTLTPMHLRKAKLMFFYVRYPSSAIIKVYFPDVRFNKNNTAQLVKWFSNFREFFYIQMEKYARQAIAEGTKNADELYVTTDSEIYRVLNLHYNRNNQIEVPENFRVVIQATLREFYHSLVAGKDSEQSWKKAIYKVIARMDDPIPEYFKSPNWMEQLSEL